MGQVKSARHRRSGAPAAPQEGYDRAAPHVGQWHWTTFWQKNERPILEDWIANTRGYGLDAGCGAMPYADLLADQGRSCVGLDTSAKMLARAAQGASGRAVTIQRGDIRAIPFEAGTFDWLVCTRVISHLRDPATAFREFARVLKPGAPCFISDIHPAHPYGNTRIRTASEMITIKSYKHRLEALKRSLKNTSAFSTTQLTEVAYAGLRWKARSPKFDKIRTDPSRPVFYVLTTSKAAKPLTAPKLAGSLVQ